MKRYLITFAFAVLTAAAQQPVIEKVDLRTPTESEIQLLRTDVRSAKKQMVAANLPLTDAEAEKFWPIYDRFTAELTKINDSKLALIRDYAIHYEDLTDEQADQFLSQRAAIEASILEVRRKYIPLLRKVLSAKSTALFFQIEWQVSTMIDLQIATQLPLIEN